MAGYRKIDATIINEKHHITLVSATDVKTVKGYFEQVPDDTIYTGFQVNDDGTLTIIFTKNRCIT